MSDPPSAPCPECGQVAERLISGGAGLLFKGDGFYITDYRSDDYRKKAEAEAPSSSAKASADSAKASADSGKAASGTASGAKSSDGGTAAKGG